MKKLVGAFLAVGVFLTSSLTGFAYEGKVYPDFMKEEKDLSKIVMSVNGFSLNDEYWEKEQTMYKSENGLIMTPVKTFSKYLGAELMTSSDKEFKTKYNGKEYQFLVGSTTVKNGDKIHQLESPVTFEKGVISVPFWDLVEIWNLSAKIENDTKILDRYVEPVKAVVTVWSKDKNTAMINLTDPISKSIVSNPNEWIDVWNKYHEKNSEKASKLYVDRFFIDTRNSYNFVYWDDEGYISAIGTTNKNVYGENMVFIKNGSIIGEAFCVDGNIKDELYTIWYIDPASKTKYPSMMDPNEIKNCQNIGFYERGLNVMTIVPNPLYSEKGVE